MGGLLPCCVSRVFLPPLLALALPGRGGEGGPSPGVCESTKWSSRIPVLCLMSPDTKTPLAVALEMLEMEESHFKGCAYARGKHVGKGFVSPHLQGSISRGLGAQSRGRGSW